MDRSTSFAWIAVAVVMLTLCQGCGGTTDQAVSVPNAPAKTDNPVIEWPGSLPLDSPQPWESLDEHGCVMINSGHHANAINADSEFVPGVERYLEAGDVSDTGEASTISSSAGTLSYAMYRIPLGGEQPGAISVDANLLSGDGYYMGLADYGSNSWEWHGPFTDNHVRLSTASGDYLSTLGSVFLCIVAWNGAGVVTIGVGVNSLDPADDSAPPVPRTPSVTPVNNGLYLEWIPVAAGDLAGYNIYYSAADFADPREPGVSSIGYLTGGTRYLLGELASVTYFRLSAVDLSGNESALSPTSQGMPAVGSTPELRLSISEPSVILNDVVTLTATGAEQFSFDTDGDGVLDVTENTTGIVSVNTSATGIIRPFVYANSLSGEAVSCGGVSLIVASNSRPVASATASPSSGDAPLDVSFTGSASTDFDGSIVGGGWDFDGDGIYDVWDDADIVHVTSANHTYGVPGTYNAKLRVVDDQGTWDVDTVCVGVAGTTANSPPFAILLGSPLTGEEPLEVVFDANNSFDLDGSIVDFEWDLDGDGVFNESGVEADSQGDPSPSPQYYTAGPPLTVAVKVTDDGSLTDTAGLTVAIHGWADPLTLDSPGNVGLHTSMAIVNGHPAVCYFDDTEDDLKYIRATDNYGSAWGTDLTLDDEGNVGRESSLVIVDGNPAISYRDLTNADLKYVRALDINGDTWGSPLTVSNTDAVGLFTSMAVVNGNPAISYYNATSDDLQFVRATDAVGGSWGTPVAPDTSGNVGWDTSLAVVDGNPAISYFDDTNEDLKYVRATNADGGTWGAPVTVDSAGNVGWYTSLAIVDGRPAISYCAGGSNDLKYVRALTPQGSSWGTAMTLDSAGMVGEYTSLAVISENPAISYYDATNGDLKFIWAMDAQGSNWQTPEAVDTPDRVGRYSSLIDLDGYPAISYYDQDLNNLKFVRMY